MTSNAAAHAVRRIAEWRENPVKFAVEELKMTPDTFQEEFLWSLKNNTRTAMKACKGPGKTTSLAVGAWWFLSCFTHPKVIATSISGDNLRDGLWAEMAKWQERSEFLKRAFSWKAERIESRDHPATWFMSARKWSKSADKEQQAHTLAGIHADNVLFLIDEAGGIPDAVVAAAEAALATIGGIKRMGMAGNPTHLSGPLYRACTKERSYWNVIEITGDPDDPKRSQRISIEWAQKQIAAYGRDNPWVMVNVFGKFPPSSLNALLGPDDVIRAMERHVDPKAYAHAAKSLGVDVARQGDDRTVIFPKQGIVMFRPKILRIQDTMQIASHVARCEDIFQPDATFVDATGGWGYGVIDKLRELGRSPIEVNYSSAALTPKFHNIRAEMSWNCAQWIKSGGCLPNIPELVEEATAVTYFFDSKGNIQIVEKDQIKEEIGRSPDLWDAASQNFAYPVVKKDPLAHLRVQPQPGQHGDYDPLRQYGAGYQQPPLADYDPLNYA